MFTGIITDVALVTKNRQDKGGITLTLKKPVSWTNLVLGESVATNGVCLTVTAIRKEEYDCYIMPETLHVASFGFTIPKQVNLERSLSAKDRFGGHFVQGHVDGIGEVVKIEPGSDYRISIAFGQPGEVNGEYSSSGKTKTSSSAKDLTESPNSELERTGQIEGSPRAQSLVIHKGSIAINGVSLTVAEVKGSVLTVALIPHTLKHTTFGVLKVGDKVNLEFDMVGKYIVNILDKTYIGKSSSRQELFNGVRGQLDISREGEKDKYAKS